VSTEKHQLSDNFRKRLAILMDKKDVTQSGIAAHCKVAQSAVSNWRKGSIPGGLELVLLADYLQVKVEDLFQSESLAERWLRTGDPKDSEIKEWKQRATDAEGRLKQLQSGLIKLLKQSSVNSDVAILAADIFEEGSQVVTPNPSTPPPPAPAERPAPNVPLETNEPPSSGRAQKKQPR
jgi:transcriptional regulator with XRE-family HTH domain